MKNHSVDVPVRGSIVKVTLDSIIELENPEFDNRGMANVVIDCLYAIKLLALEIKSLKEEVKEMESRMNKPDPAHLRY